MSSLKLLSLSLRVTSPLRNTIATTSSLRHHSSFYQTGNNRQINNACCLLATEPPSTLKSGLINLEFRRFKKLDKRKTPPSQQEILDAVEAEEGGKEEEEDDDGDDELASENPLLVDDIDDDSKLSSDLADKLTININSLRLDTFCKTAFHMTRVKVEEAFYKGNIYVNGERAAKKALDLSINDEVDIVKHVKPDDHNMVHIRRAVITKLPDHADDQGRIKLDIIRYQDLVVDAYSINE